MKIKLLKDFRGKKAGASFEWPDPMAKKLFAAGIAVPLDGVVEKEVTAPVKDKMQRKRKTK